MRTPKIVTLRVDMQKIRALHGLSKEAKVIDATWCEEIQNVIISVADCCIDPYSDKVLQ